MEPLMCPEVYSLFDRTSRIMAPCFTNSAKSVFGPKPNKFLIADNIVVFVLNVRTPSPERGTKLVLFYLLF